MLAGRDGGSNYFYNQNLRGDVMMLVKSNGEVSSIWEYDASGQMLGQALRNRDPFRFTGGLGSGDGLWKLGVRFYDSGKNSFIQQDRYMGDPSDPLSLNRYVYYNMDPVNFVDPTGFCLLPLLGFAFGQALPPPDAPFSEVLASGFTGALLFSGIGQLYGAYRLQRLISGASELKMTQTVQNHMNDFVKSGAAKGELSRPYLNSNESTLLLKEIMSGGNPVKDLTLKNGLRWDVAGTFRGSQGTWELVVNVDTNTIVHWNFVSSKQ